MALQRGLCDICVHQRLVPNTRGSVFSLCQRSLSDDAYVRYPAIPMLECRGFEPRSDEGGPSGGGDGPAAIESQGRHTPTPDPTEEDRDG